MDSETKNFLKLIGDVFEAHHDKYHVACVANVKGLTKTKFDYHSSPVETEYFSVDQMKEIEESLTRCGCHFDLYTDEDAFIKEVEEHSLFAHGRQPIVINFAQQGTGSARKSLIPAFCDMHGVPYAGSDAFVSSLCRHKTVWHGYLRDLHFPVCDYWIYDAGIGWVGDKPDTGAKLIVKVNGETSSIGLSAKSSIITYDPECDDVLKEAAQAYGSRLLLEPLISGKEVEIPLMNHGGSSYCLGVAGISHNEQRWLGDVILDYDIRGTHKFDFYDYDEDDPFEAEALAEEAKRISLAFGLNGYCRIDFRINDKGEHFVTDISSTPHLTKSMTFAYLFSREGIPYEHVYKYLLGEAIAAERGLLK